MKPIPTAFLLLALGCEEEQPVHQENYGRLLKYVVEVTPEQEYQRSLPAAVSAAVQGLGKLHLENDILNPDTTIRGTVSLDTTFQGTATSSTKQHVHLSSTYISAPADASSEEGNIFLVAIAVSQESHLFSFATEALDASSSSPWLLKVEMKQLHTYNENPFVWVYSIEGLQKGKGFQHDFRDLRLSFVGQDRATNYKDLNYDQGCTSHAYKIPLSEDQWCTHDGNEGYCTKYACVTDVPLEQEEIGLVQLANKIMDVYQRSAFLLKEKK